MQMYSKIQLSLYGAIVYHQRGSGSVRENINTLTGIVKTVQMHYFSYKK